MINDFGKEGNWHQQREVVPEFNFERRHEYVVF